MAMIITTDKLTKDGNDYVGDASTLQMNKTVLEFYVEGVLYTLAKTLKNRDNEIVGWEYKNKSRTVTIYND